MFLFLAGCSSYPVKRVGIIHEYILYGAQKACEKHDGLHYIVTSETIEAEHSSNDRHDYPCHGVYGIRCQDDTLFNFDSEVKWCFISESQLSKTMKTIDPKYKVNFKWRE